jgi:hypothetical protein
MLYGLENNIQRKPPKQFKALFSSQKFRMNTLSKIYFQSWYNKNGYGYNEAK